MLSASRLLFPPLPHALSNSLLGVWAVVKHSLVDSSFPSVGCRLLALHCFLGVRQRGGPVGSRHVALCAGATRPLLALADREVRRKPHTAPSPALAAFLLEPRFPAAERALPPPRRHSPSPEGRQRATWLCAQRAFELQGLGWSRGPRRRQPEASEARAGRLKRRCPDPPASPARPSGLFLRPLVLGVRLTRAAWPSRGTGRDCTELSTRTEYNLKTKRTDRKSVV